MVADFRVEDCTNGLNSLSLLMKLGFDVMRFMYPAHVVIGMYQSFHVPTICTPWLNMSQL